MTADTPQKGKTMTRLDEIRKAELKKLNDRIAALEAVAEAARVFLPAVKNSTHDWGAYASARDALEAALELVE